MQICFVTFQLIRKCNLVNVQSQSHIWLLWSNLVWQTNHFCKQSFNMCSKINLTCIQMDDVNHGTTTRAYMKPINSNTVRKVPALVSNYTQFIILHTTFYYFYCRSAHENIKYISPTQTSSHWPVVLLYYTAYAYDCVQPLSNVSAHL